MTGREVINELCAALINKGIERVNNGEAVCLDSYARAALDAAEALEKIFQNLPNPWTPVSEAMPDYFVNVLVTYKRGDGINDVGIDYAVVSVNTADGTKPEDSLWEYKPAFRKNVSAWAPLPKPYEEERNEQ